MSLTPEQAEHELFTMYEPRPKYTAAVRLTHHNMIAIAEHVNSVGSCGISDVIALVQPGSKLILQTHDGEEVGRAYPWDYIVRTKTGFTVIKDKDFGQKHRKCVGDER